MRWLRLRGRARWRQAHAPPSLELPEVKPIVSEYVRLRGICSGCGRCALAGRIGKRPLAYGRLMFRWRDQAKTHATLPGCNGASRFSCSWAAHRISAAAQPTPAPTCSSCGQPFGCSCATPWCPRPTTPPSGRCATTSSSASSPTAPAPSGGCSSPSASSQRCRPARCRLGWPTTLSTRPCRAGSDTFALPASCPSTSTFSTPPESQRLAGLRLRGVNRYDSQVLGNHRP